MTAIPTGTVTRNDDDTCELTITRLFPNATAEDVWASITESERTARWCGPWRGEAGVGKVIEAQMTFEDTDDWMKMRIDACEPPRVLAISSLDEFGAWHMELQVRDLESGVALDLTQHKLDPTMAENVGPGWEYYLDMLVASRNDAPLPDFADYYPSQSEYYKSQTGV